MNTSFIPPKFIKKDGIYYFSHVFDFTDPNNGYEIENERDYTADGINGMLDTEATKKWMEMNNALIMYGHGARDLEKKQYLPREHNPLTGEVQFPLGSITSMKVINSYSLQIQGQLVPTPHNHVESVVRLALAGLGKFSMVWNLPKKILFGMDFVLIGAFATNRLAQKLCEGDDCTLDSLMGIKDPILLSDAKGLMKTDENYPLLREVQSLKGILRNRDSLVHEKEMELKVLQTQLDSLSNIFTPVSEHQTKIIESKRTHSLDEDTTPWVRSSKL